MFQPEDAARQDRVRPQLPALAGEGHLDSLQSVALGLEPQMVSANGPNLVLPGILFCGNQPQKPELQVRRTGDVLLVTATPFGRIRRSPFFRIALSGSSFGTAADLSRYFRDDVVRTAAVQYVAG